MSDLRTALEEAMKEQENKDQDAEAAPPEPEEPEEPEEADSQDDEDQPEDAAEEDQAEDATEPDGVDDDNQPDTEQDEDGDDEDDGEPIAPPQSLNKEEKEEWKKLPREAQTILRRRLSDHDRHFHRRNQEIAKKEREYGAIAEVFEPYRQQMDMHGIDPSSLVKQWAAIDRSMGERPEETIQFLAQRTGVDLVKLAQSMHQQQQTGELDPRVQQLQQQVQKLQGTLTLQQQAEQQSRLREQQQAQTQLEQQIESFRTATDDRGRPRYPYFDDLREAMAGLISSGQADGLEDAYEKAEWAVPDIRQAKLDAERQKAAKAAQAERRKKATRARKAGVSVKGSPGGAAPEQPVGSVAEELRKAYRRFS